ncbi:tyrosine-type recombinase/integrase [Butyrivibrio sp. YAB3001]|uniref:tyrosine-type recombinase/integrase n=1 Tax=Butyrivibrio sp. YAB3001 TaxID=1520812 RepID=UPI0008F642FE|nr:tyrosine-type recombinase/integrase [Butyrivibrio sp. YAB3001]SFD01176.1 integrase/recombinase XerD [Butyrivibrio sp. YAB3001]
MEKLIDEFEIYLSEVKKTSYNTLMSYKRDLQKMIKYMENCGVAQISGITEDKLFGYVGSLSEQHFAAASMIRHITTIKSFFRYLVENGNISDNPAENLKAPKAEKRKPRILNAHEVESLLGQEFPNDSKGKRDKAILELLYATGLKTSELVNLRLKNIDLSLNCVRLDEDRVIPYGKKAKEALNDYLLFAREQMIPDEGDASELVFVNYKGDQMSRQGLWKLIKAYVVKAGIDLDVTPFVLRNSFAVHLIENGADEKTLKGMLGYNDIGTIKKYIKGKDKHKDPYEWARIRN